MTSQPHLKRQEMPLLRQLLKALILLKVQLLSVPPTLMRQRTQPQPQRQLSTRIPPTSKRRQPVQRRQLSRWLPAQAVQLNRPLSKRIHQPKGTLPRLRQQLQLVRPLQINQAAQPVQQRLQRTNPLSQPTASPIPTATFQSQSLRIRSLSWTPCSINIWLNSTQPTKLIISWLRVIGSPTALKWADWSDNWCDWWYYFVR